MTDTSKEAIERLAAFLEAPGTPHIIPDPTTASVLRALRAELDKDRACLVPTVKELEWVDDNDKEVWAKAVTPVGTYFICDDTDDFTGFYVELISHDDARWWQHVRSTSEMIMDRHHDDDLSPLKAAAQADYERRILSALDLSPVTPAQAAEVLMADGEIIVKMAEAISILHPPVSGVCAAIKAIKEGE